MLTTSRRTAFATVLSTALLLSGCSGAVTPDASTVLDDAAGAIQPSTAESTAPAPVAEPDDAAGPVAGEVCLTTFHSAVTIDGVEYPSHLIIAIEFLLEGDATATIASEEFNSGNGASGPMFDGYGEYQLGIMAYGDYLFPEVAIDGTAVEIEMSPPYTVDDDEGEASRECVSGSYAVPA